MKKYLVIIIAVLVAGVALLTLGGCKDKPSPDTESDIIVKTDAEYKQQAEKEITKDNMLEELEKLEESVDQDTGQ
jgi:hypothetical protein